MSLPLRPEDWNGNIPRINPKVYSELSPWTEPKLKGKTVLVNDTFVRVDDIPSYALFAKYGERHPIMITSSMGKTGLAMNACQGHVVAPDYDYNHAFLPGTKRPTYYLRSRCMTEDELVEARKDHIFARSHSASWEAIKETSVEIVNVPGKEVEQGIMDGDLRLRAFNKALHKRRQEIAAKMAERGLKWDFDKFFNATYIEDKMSELFARKVPPPPSELKTGRENPV